MDRSIELELREDIKDINKKMTDIQKSIATLTAKQNVGAWVFKSMLTVVVAVISGYFGASCVK